MARIKPQALLQQSKKKKAPSRISGTTILFCGLIVVLALFFLYSTYTHRSIRFVAGACLRFSALEFLSVSVRSLDSSSNSLSFALLRSSIQRSNTDSELEVFSS
ncbi:unnamed protein product [Linum tenue]|uniref:Uncharacterized protein n=1 Tax=Linum tenue TaxID=586396 RepID=A0AAV0J1B7_9ROSI|nr:unnamed protein product [Linum tenue]